MASRLRRMLFGAPIRTDRAHHERLSKLLALPVFSSDALSSVAYGTQEIILALLAARIGMAAFHWTMPIAWAIVGLLVIVTVSYQQTIHAYPGGGGAYIVARDNLGVGAALTAGAALLLDYILTVSVSVAAGIDAIISAAAHNPRLFAELDHWRVPLCLFAVLFITVANLRGVKESGALFALPTYSFVVLTVAMVVWGFVKLWTGQPLTVPAGEPLGPAHEVGLFLVLKAFASGCSALTGVEAISNGVTAFKAPEAKNAGITMIWMSSILAVMFLGITFFATHLHVQYATGSETVISQVARAILGTGPAYYLLQIATCGVLVLAANTSFADFPRLCALQAADGFLPRQLRNIGDRLVFSNGIVVLGIISGLIIAVFGGHTDYLIPLYAVGVFLSFTLSQAGMVRRWFRLKSAGWQWKAVVNGLGAAVTGIVAVVICISKWAAGEPIPIGSYKLPTGAWMIVVLIPALVYVFFLIYNHYRAVAEQLTLECCEEPLPRVNTVLVLVPDVHRGVLPALQFARSLGTSVRAVHVELNPAKTAKVLSKWARWGKGVPLVVLESPYRSLVDPLLTYIDAVEAEREDDHIVLVLPEFVPGKWWEKVLHTHTGLMLKFALMGKENVIVCNVRYFLRPFSGPITFHAHQYREDEEQLAAPPAGMDGTLPSYEVVRHVEGAGPAGKS